MTKFIFVTGGVFSAVGKGFIISGTSPDNSLVNCIELRKELHPFYVGAQFYPEFQSTIINPHPLFIKLLCI